MKETDIKFYQTYARLGEFKRKVEKAKGVIQDALQHLKTPYVACSFGKDSAVLLDLVLQQKPDCTVKFMRWRNETEFLDNFAETIAAWQLRQSVNLEIIEFERQSLDEKILDRYEIFEQGADGYFIGFRADESKGRAMTLKKHGLVYKMKSGLWRIAPLGWWSARDIAAFTITRNLPTLSRYLSEGFDARTSARIPREDYGIRAASLAELKRRAPDKFNELAIKFPEIRQYA